MFIKHDFMINLHGSYVAELGFELATPGFSLKRYQLHHGARSCIILQLSFSDS